MSITPKPTFGDPTEPLIGYWRRLPSVVRQLVQIDELADRATGRRKDALLLKQWEAFLVDLEWQCKVTELHIAGAQQQVEWERSRADKRQGRIDDALRSMTVATLGGEERFDPHGFFVYCLWGSEEIDGPLYVGQSQNILARLGSHLGDPEKRRHVSRVTLVRLRTARLMCDAEKRLIRQMRPPWNHIYNHGNLR